LLAIGQRCKNMRKLVDKGIHINEDLCKSRLQLLQAKKKFGERNSWTEDGKVVVKLNDKKNIMSHHLLN